MTFALLFRTCFRAFNIAFQRPDDGGEAAITFCARRTREPALEGGCRDIGLVGLSTARPHMRRRYHRGQRCAKGLPSTFERPRPPAGDVNGHRVGGEVEGPWGLPAWGGRHV